MGENRGSRAEGGGWVFVALGGAKERFGKY